MLNIDEEGRVCLNDLHRLAGGTARKKPGYFLEGRPINELIGRLSVEGGRQAVVVVVVGDGWPLSRRSTWAFREIAQRYAEWISLEFADKVAELLRGVACAVPAGPDASSGPRRVGEPKLFAAPRGGTVRCWWLDGWLWLHATDACAATGDLQRWCIKFAPPHSLQQVLVGRDKGRLSTLIRLDGLACACRSIKVDWIRRHGERLVETLAQARVPDAPADTTSTPAKEPAMPAPTKPARAAARRSLPGTAVKLDKASGQPVKAGAPAAQEPPELLRHTMRPISFDGDRSVRVMMDAAGGLFVSLRDAGDVLGDDRHLLLKTAFKQDGLRFADAGGRAPHAFVPATACIEAMLGRQGVDADFRVKVADWVGAVSAAFPEAAMFGIGVYTPAGREGGVGMPPVSGPKAGMPPVSGPAIAPAQLGVVSGLNLVDPAAVPKEDRRSETPWPAALTARPAGQQPVSVAPVVAAPAAEVADGLPPLMLEGIAIRRDAAGRYSLNDLHKASGGAGHHQPAKFFSNKGTKDLVEELKINSPNSESSPVASMPGATGGTYVVKELVYAYAMWISAAFHLKVIRAYDKLVTQPAPAPVPETREQILARALLLSNDVIREKDELIGQQAEVISVLEPKAAALDRIADSEGTRCITDAAAELGVTRGVLIEQLMAHRWLYRRYEKGPLCCYAEALAAKVVAMVETEGGGKTRPQARITSYGLTRLAILLPKWLAGERPPMPKAPPSPQGSLLH